MPVMIFTMLIVLVLAAAIIAVVVMGMEGTGRKQHPEIADAMARTARHLNGEGEPPKALVQLFDEIDEVGDINVRELPDKLRASARSAWSARSALSARSAASAASANPPEGDEVWAPAPAVVEASVVDESAARAMSEALAAPASDPVEDDPYGVLAAAGVEAEQGSADEARSDVESTPVNGAQAADDTVVRVHLPEGEPRA